MNIRKKVIFSFVILILFIISISSLSLITTYHMKENASFAKEVSKLINIQEDMNELINLATLESSLKNLDKIKENFNSFEKKFELLKHEILKKNKKDFIDNIIHNIRQNDEVKSHLDKLFENEHTIELIFDEVYNFQKKHVFHQNMFKKVYPKEDEARNKLQKLIKETKSLTLVQEFGDLKYYSKETLYQHKDKERYEKWISSIDKIILELLKKDEKELFDLFTNYKKTVQKVGKIVLDINNIEKQEKVLVNVLISILKENKQVSVSIERKIEEITDQFLSNLSTLEFTLVASIVFITFVLTLYITSRLTIILKKLKNGVQKLKNGDYDANISIQEDKEFNEIAKTFNNMSQNIKENQNTLEQRIKSRTNELQTALINIQEQKDTLENLSNKLSKYLSPQIFESIFSGKQDVQLESKRKYLTVFFSDIQGFTDLTDSVETETLTQLLNEYLDIMSSIVIKHGGTIDKYIGDSIMVFFGDPLSNGKTKDAISCINMAIEMREAMGELRIKWQKDGISKPVHIRMGINSGYCTVGNFGSKNRLDYTIIGGVVNLASRLESNANPDEILISSETYMFIKDSIKCTKREELNVKGISHPIQTYEVLSSSSNSTIIEEQNGFNLILDLNEINKSSVISTLKNTILSIEKNS